MSPREEAQARLDEAEDLLRQAVGVSFTVPLAASWFSGGLVVAMPIVFGFGAIALWRYRRAKRELAALSEPPTARLLP